MYQVTLYVLGNSCLETYYSIEKEVKELSGILSFKGSVLKGKFVIEFKPGLVCAKEIVKRIENRGYSVWKKVQKEYCFEMFN